GFLSRGLRGGREQSYDISGLRARRRAVRHLHGWRRQQELRHWDRIQSTAAALHGLREYGFPADQRYRGDQLPLWIDFTEYRGRRKFHSGRHGPLHGWRLQRDHTKYPGPQWQGEWSGRQGRQEPRNVELSYGP